MGAARLCAGLQAAALLAACQVGSDPDDQPVNAQASAEGKAQEGRISIQAPGFDLAIALPKEMADEARADRDSKLLYPGATIRGIHVAAVPGEKESGSEVDIRLATPDPLDKVLAWYRDPARADGFELDEAKREGAGHRLTGIQKRDRHPFKLVLTPRPGGGTDGRLTVSHKD